MSALNWRGVRRARLERLLLLCTLTLLALLALSSAAPAQTLPPGAQTYRAQLVRAAHTEWGLDAPIAALAAQVHQESGWQPDALSRAGAQGLAQFMPSTATWWCKLQGDAQADCMPQNPTWALRSMVSYDRWLYERTPSQWSERDRFWVALRAYNGGLGHWQNERRQASQNSRAGVDAACGRASRAPIHCAENLGYPRRILVLLQPLYESWGPGL